MGLAGKAYTGGSWGEQAWERYLIRAETRNVKFDELYETFRNHPQRNRLIAQEMGWTENMRVCGGAEGLCSTCKRRTGCEVYAMLHVIAEPETAQSDPQVAALCAGFDELEHIPAFVAARALAEALETIARREAYREPACMAEQAMLHIAEGHGIGYRRDAVAGNVVSCRHAQRNLQDCITRLDALNAVFLSSKARKALHGLEQRIAELRSRMA